MKHGYAGNVTKMEVDKWNKKNNCISNNKFNWSNSNNSNNYGLLSNKWWCSYSTKINNKTAWIIITIRINQWDQLIRTKLIFIKCSKVIIWCRHKIKIIIKIAIIITNIINNNSILDKAWIIWMWKNTISKCNLNNQWIFNKDQIIDKLKCIHKNTTIKILANKKLYISNILHLIFSKTHQYHQLLISLNPKLNIRTNKMNCIICINLMIYCSNKKCKGTVIKKAIEGNLIQDHNNLMKVDLILHNPNIQHNNQINKNNNRTFIKDHCLISESRNINSKRENTDPKNLKAINFEMFKFIMCIWLTICKLYLIFYNNKKHLKIFLIKFNHQKYLLKLNISFTSKNNVFSIKFWKFYHLKKEFLSFSSFCISESMFSNDSSFSESVNEITMLFLLEIEF